MLWSATPSEMLTVNCVMQPSSRASSVVYTQPALGVGGSAVTATLSTRFATRTATRSAWLVW